MKLDHLQSLNSRLEIKFVFSDLEYLSALEIIDDLPMLTRAYSDRTISSVYFDTLEGGYAKDNLIGLSNRLKLRFRYYNNNYTIGFFETKLKKNKVGTKKTIKSISNITSNKVSDLAKYFSTDEILISSHIPSTKVTYLRSYYESIDGLRLTLDKDIHMCEINNLDNVSKKETFYYPRVIIEIKASPDILKKNSYLIRRIGRSPQRHSKYLISLALLGKIQYL